MWDLYKLLSPNFTVARDSIAAEILAFSSNSLRNKNNSAPTNEETTPI